MRLNLKINKHLLYVVILLIIVSFGGGWLTGVVWEKQQGGSSKIILKAEDLILGNPNAPVTFLEYSDFQCVFCAQFFRNSFPLLKSEYIDTDKIRFIHRDFILYGQESILAANAARCAGEQGKFWEYHNLLFQKQRGISSGTFSLENLKKFGGELHLDREKFEKCVDGVRYEKKIKESTAEAKKKLGVWGTPSFFINQSGPIFGSLDYRKFKILIDNALASSLEN